MRVRIEREVCTGAGDCARAVDEVFWMADDGLAMVKEDAAHFGETRTFADEVDVEQMGFTAWARVPETLEDAVVEAAAACPGACIVVDEAAPPTEGDEPAEPVEPEAADAVGEAAADAGPDDSPPPTPAPTAGFTTRVARRLRRLFRS